MKRAARVIVISGLLLGISLSFGFFDRKPDKDRVLLELVQIILERFHYSPSKLNNDFSVSFYNDYLENLDYSKRYFIQSDIDDFEPFKILIDDQIKLGDLTFFDLTYQRLSKRISNINQIQNKILSTPFDFSIDENYISDPEKLGYAKNTEELHERWRLYIKYNVLSKLLEDIDAEKSKEKEDANYKAKSFETLEKEARESTLKIFNDWHERLMELNKDDWFSVYLNVLTSQFDPHTNYFAPRDKEKFDESISGQLEGIGARLTSKDGYTTVAEIISGSPSWKQGELEVEDKIVKVAQGNGEYVNIVGMRLDDSVDLIKGKKGSSVRLFVKKIDGSQKEIVIVRDVVEIEETFAKSAVINSNGKKYGIINLPKFYVNFDNKDSRNAASDIKKEIIALKKQNVQGIILDLRNNGGGSLQAAVEIAGFFIKKGPIVQVKPRNAAPQVLADEDASVLYDGPLTVLVNEYSASASEIVAAALRDYQRAVIIGSEHTFGKGTVQNFWDLDNMINPELNLSSLGSLKMTIQKFYRINGGATQLKGVESDIVLPGRYSYIKIGEKEEQNAMPWDTINRLSYDTWGAKINYQLLKKKSSSRVSASKYFNLINENAKWLETRNNIYTIPLNLEKFEKENKDYTNAAAKFKELSTFSNKLEFSSAQSNDKNQVNNKDFQEKQKRWFNALSKDIYIGEAVNVLNDLK